MELLLAAIVIIILIFSAILHEIMHGWVADKLGDPTARLMGRLTLNPLPHIDPIMTILIPIVIYFASSGQFIFAAAKPVPVNLHHLKEGRKDFAIVALAGPLTNAAIAIVAALLAHVFTGSDVMFSLLKLVAHLNLFLAFLNLIPIPPLDGSRVVSFLLPDELARTYLSIESFGIFILFLLLSFPIGGLNIGLILSNLVYFTMHLLGL